MDLSIFSGFWSWWLRVPGHEYQCVSLNMPFCPDLGRQSTLQPSWKGPVKSVIITGAVYFSCIDRSDGYQARDQKELKPYIRMHLLTWLKMNIAQFLLRKFVKIRRKSFIIVSWPGEDCQIKQWWSTDQRDIKEETTWASQGDIPVRDPKVVICLVWWTVQWVLCLHEVGEGWGWWGMYPIGFCLKKKIYCLHCASCAIFVPLPEIESVPREVEVQILNHWPCREVPPIEEEKLKFYMTSWLFCLCNSACSLQSLDHIGHVVSENGDLNGRNWSLSQSPLSWSLQLPGLCKPA